MLKPLLEITVPDTRWRHFGCHEGFQPLTLEGHYADIDGLALVGAAPGEAIIAWDRARNTYLLSWYCYDLISVAVPQALMALELAGRIRLAQSAKGCRGLHSIIERLVGGGILKERYRPPLTLAKTAAEFRNHWQHGTADLADPNLAYQTMQFCKDLIDAMYPHIDRQSERTEA